jgi:hypothetical protein
MMRIALGLAIVVVMLASACGASDTYSVDEAKTAFESQGLELREALPQAGGAATPWGSGRKLLAPRGKVPFLVYVGSATDAEHLWSMYTANVSEGDSFDARRANVVAISDGGLAARDRARVKAALESLPDKGSPVLVVAGTDAPG